MLHEIELERRTRGLVYGPALLSSSASTGLHLPLRETRGWIITDDPLSNSILPSLRPWLRTYKIIIRAREGGEVLWVRAFRSRIDAGIVWARLIGVDLEHARHLQVRFPTTWIQGELEYLLATVDTFTSVGSTTWTPVGTAAPASVDYLVVAGGGGGGFNQGGGGGAGGFRTATGHAAGYGKTVTVGGGGAGGPNVGSPLGSRGGDSVFDDVTSNGGGGAGGQGNAAPAGTYGSGAGGGGNTGGSTTAASSGTAGQGNNGGTGQGTSPAHGGGGGGASSAGANGSPGPGNGGSGSSSSISGASVAYAGGGGGGCNQSGTAGTGGSSIGGAGHNTTAGGNAVASTGSGGGGGGNNGGTAFAGGSGAPGIVILSYTPVYFVFPPPVRRFIRR
jgi:hypothetical protein